MAMYLGTTQINKIYAGSHEVSYGYVGSDLVFGLHANTKAFLARVSQQTTARQILYDALVRSLVSSGVWGKLDVLCVYAAIDQTTALANLKSSSFGQTAVNSPNFAVNQGFAGNGSTSYINTNFTASTAGGVYALNSAHISFWGLTNRAAVNAVQMGIVDNAAPIVSPMLAVRRNGDFFYFNINDNQAGVSVAVNANSSGFFSVSRTDSANNNGYLNGSLLSTQAAASTGVPKIPYYVCGRNSNGALNLPSSDRIAAATIGAGLSATDEAALYSALHTYLQAVAGVA